jgi:hypothetical protein
MTTSAAKRGPALSSVPPVPPVPSTAPPLRKPAGFDTRTQAMNAEVHAREAGVRHGPSSVDLGVRFKRIMAMAPAGPDSDPSGVVRELAPKAAPDGPATLKFAVATPSRRETAESSRLTALAAERRPGGLTRAAVRPDYFGTAEHKALAEYLKTILEGKPVGPEVEPTAASHVLLYRRAPQATPLLAPTAIPFSDLGVSATGDDWLQKLRQSLADILVDYKPNLELFVRPDLTLQYGEIVALAGDYFGCEEELRAEMTPKIAEAIRDITEGTPGAPGNSGTNVLSTHRGWFEYLKLAYRNQTHFTPRNWVTYARHHATALQHALARSYDDALIANAFADHFLSDAFASGHLRVPRDGLKGILGVPASRSMHDEENTNGLWVQDLTGNVWRAYGDDNLGRNPVHVVMTAYAVGLSQQRIHRAYRLEGAAGDQLSKAIGAGLAALPEADDETSWPAGLWRNPAELPDFLGAIAGLPDIRARLPVPVGASDAPKLGSLANYPPLRGLAADGKIVKREGEPPFRSYFDLQSLQGAPPT